jgi:hypothetical protein
MVCVGPGRRLASATQPDPELHWNELFANSSGNASRSRAAHTGAFFWVSCPHRWPTKATRIPASATLLGSPTGLSVSPSKLASHKKASAPPRQPSVVLGMTGRTGQDTITNCPEISGQLGGTSGVRVVAVQVRIVQDPIPELTAQPSLSVSTRPDHPRTTGLYPSRWTL